MKRILVIGKNSYIGTSFQKYAVTYAPELEVTLVGAKDGAWRSVDLGAYDAVLHVAAIVHKKEQPDMQQMYDAINTELPLEIAKKAKENGVSRFAFLSTMAVYGKAQSPIGKETPTEPLTMYGKSKLAAEKRLRKLADKSFKVVIFRPPMVYGEKCPGNYGRLAKLAYKIPVFPKVKNQRSMIYIENLCACICKEMYNAEIFRVVCPQNTEYVNTTELVKSIRKSHGKATLILPFPQIILRVCASKIDIFEKIFGDCYYRHEVHEKEYQIADFSDTVNRTEIGKKALITASVASMIDLFNMDNIHILQKMGYDVEVAANFEKGNVTSDERIVDFKEELRQAGIKIHQVPIPRNIGSIKYIIKSYRQLKELCSCNQYAIVHTQTPIGGVVTRIAARKARQNRTKVIYMAHGFHFFKGASKKNWLLFYPTEWFCAKFTDVLITINQEDYVRAKRFPAKQVHYVPGFGLDVSKYKENKNMALQLREEFGLSDDDYVLLSVGELTKRKNQETVIRSMAQIKDERIHYVLVGRGELLEADRALITELGLEKRIILAGYRENISEFLHMSDCFVFPSLQEGLPAALMEAMAAGVPIICSKIRGNTDLITDGVEGKLVEPMDVAGYAAAVMEVKENPDMRQKFSQNASIKIQKFSRSHVHEIMENIYRDVEKRE